jgi:hypothetical protein
MPASSLLWAQCGICVGATNAGNEQSWVCGQGQAALDFVKEVEQMTGNETPPPLPMRGPKRNVDRPSRAFDSAVQAVTHAISLVEQTAGANGHARTVRRPHWELRRDLPYAIERVPGTDLRIPVNRMYKPVGVHAEYGCNWWANYEDWPHLHFALTDEQQAAVVRPGAWKALFLDGEGPWTSRSCAVAYLARLRALRALVAGDHVAELLQSELWTHQ